MASKVEEKNNGSGEKKKKNLNLQQLEVAIGQGKEVVKDVTPHLQMAPMLPFANGVYH